MPSQVFTYALWLTPTVLLVVLAVLLWRRKLAAEFPVFFSYTLMHVARACVLFAVYRGYGYSSFLYFCAYWIAEAVDAGFQLAVIYEVYARLFQPYESLGQLGKSLFRWSMFALVVLAVASALAAPGSESDALRTGVLVLHQSTIVICGGLLLLLFIFATSFGLTWRQYVFGIAAGLCLSTSVELAVVVILSRWGAMGSRAYSLIHAAAYNCSVLLWVGYFLRRESAPEMRVAVPRAALDEWNEALAELLNR